MKLLLEELSIKSYFVVNDYHIPNLGLVRGLMSPLRFGLFEQAAVTRQTLGSLRADFATALYSF